MSSTGSSRGARYHECDALDACASLRLPSAGTRMASNLGDKFSTLHEIVRAARNNLAPGPWDYLIGGAETETTVRRNRLALDSIAFRPRVLRDVSKIDTTSTFFGRPVRIPVMLAPIGSIETFAEGGGATAAKAAEDATLATDHGVEGVYVSNHGGRQLDHGRGAIEALPEVVRAVGGRATVIVDGGFVRGTDVVKALALGAQCVGIGRLACCGLAAAGPARRPGRRDPERRGPAGRR